MATQASEPSLTGRSKSEIEADLGANRDRLAAAVSELQINASGLVPERRTVLRHGDDLLVVTPRRQREATEARMRQVSDNGRLAQWVGDPPRHDKD